MADGIAVDFNADQAPVIAPGMDHTKRFPADEIRLLVEIDQAPEAKRVRIVFTPYIGIKGQQRAFNAADGVGGGRNDVVILAGLHDGLPQLVAMDVVLQVKLVAEFTAPAGAADRHLEPVEFRLDDIVIPHVQDFLAQQTVGNMR